MDLCIACSIIYAIYGWLLLSKAITFTFISKIILIVGAIILALLYIRAETNDSIERYDCYLKGKEKDKPPL